MISHRRHRPARSSSARSPCARRRWSSTSSGHRRRARRRRRRRSGQRCRPAHVHADEAAGCGVRANADTPEDAARARRMGAEGIGLCRTEHMFLGDRKQLRRAADPGRDRRATARPRSTSCCRCSARTSSGSSRRWTACRSRSGCSTRRCTSSCPTSPSCRCGSRVAEDAGQAERGRPAPAARRAPAARVEPDAGPARRAPRPGRARAVRAAGAGDRRGRVLPSTAGGDPQAEIMIPLVGSVHELELIVDEAEQVARRRRRASTACTLRLPDRHDDRAAARRADRRRDRRGRRVLLVRHQRPDPDDLGLQPRRRRGRVLLRVPGARACSASRRSRRIDVDGVGRLVRMAAEEGRAVRPD